MSGTESKGKRDRPEMGDSRDVLRRGCGRPIIAEMKEVITRRGSAGVATQTCGESLLDAFNQKREGGFNCQEKKRT
jgi:hypothetical protein